jgi:anaerobic selenocysteine-containing dehydrogenase
MNAQTSETIAHRICPFCEACCGLELTLENGRVTRVRGHAEDVFSQGYLCPKAVALRDLHEDPDRLRRPLIKRNGKFIEATWEEALEEVERRLPLIMAAQGRDSAAIVLGNPVVHKIDLLLYATRLARAMGTHNVFSASTLDQMPKHVSCGLMFGDWLTIPVPDIERTDFLLILGANPMVSNGSLWTVPNFRDKAKALRTRGGKLVVIDPRRTDTAKAADQHFFIRPGADVYFLLGLAHTIFQEDLAKLGRLEKHVAGLAEVKAAVQEFSPERVAQRCGIAADTIRDLARQLAHAKRAAVYGRVGTCTQEFGTLCSWLVDVLNVLTGHLDEAGGAMFPKAAAFAANTLGKPGKGRGVTTGRRKSRVSGAPEVMGEYPISCLAEEIETPGQGQIKALITVGSNPVLSAPNGPRLSAALGGLDFMLSVDIYLNETTRHADVILPGTSPLEGMHYDAAFTQLSFRNHARVSRPVLPRSPGQPEEWETLTRLAAIVMGRGAQADVAQVDDELTAQEARRMAGPFAAMLLKIAGRGRGPQRLLDVALRAGPYGDRFGLKPSGLNLKKVMAAKGGIDLGPLAPRIPEILRTPSGKIELAPSIFLADVKRAAAGLGSPAAELVMIGRRQLHSNNSWMHNLPVLAKSSRCTVLVNPADAERLGLRDGARARITRGNRCVEANVEISDDMMPGVVSLPHGWGHDLPGVKLSIAAGQPGTNLNALFDENLRDPLSGDAVLTGVPVQMTPLP